MCDFLDTPLMRYGVYSLYKHNRTNDARKSDVKKMKSRQLLYAPRDGCVHSSALRTSPRALKLD